jgi:histone H3/H4
MRAKYNMTQQPATIAANNGLLRIGFKQIIYFNIEKFNLSIFGCQKKQCYIDYMPKEINEQYSFNTYIYKVLKEVNPDTGLTADAKSQMNLLVHEVLEDLVDAIRIIHKSPNANKTISSREVQTAVRLVFPGELAKHAVSEGTKALTKFSNSTGKGSKVKMAKLQFPPSRVENVLRTLLPGSRIRAGASVYAAGVLEYITAEVLELSGNAARDNRRGRINTRHMFLAISNDEELNKIFSKSVMGSNVTPNIQRVLLPNPYGRVKRPGDYHRNTTYAQGLKRGTAPSPFTRDQINSMKNAEISRVCKEYKIRNCGPEYVIGDDNKSVSNVDGRRQSLRSFFNL